MVIEGASRSWARCGQRRSIRDHGHVGAWRAPRSGADAGHAGPRGAIQRRSGLFGLCKFALSRRKQGFESRSLRQHPESAGFRRKLLVSTAFAVRRWCKPVVRTMSTRGRVARQLMTTPWVHPKTGGLYYRKVIPPRARHLFGGKVEVRRSLGTRDPRQARLRYAEIAHEVEARIAAAGAPPGPASHEQLGAPAGEWYRRKLAAWGPEPGAAREWAVLAQDLHEDVKALIVRDR